MQYIPFQGSSLLHGLKLPRCSLHVSKKAQVSEENALKDILRLVAVTYGTPSHHGFG